MRKNGRKGGAMEGRRNGGRERWELVEIMAHFSNMFKPLLNVISFSRQEHLWEGEVLL